MLSFSETALRIRRTHRRQEKEDLVSEYLHGRTHTQIASAVLFFSEIPIRGDTGNELNVHASVYPKLAEILFHIPRDLYRACHQVSGDHGEVLGKLQSTSAEKNVPIEDAEEFLREMADLKKNESKLLSLERYLAPLHASIVTCVIRIITRSLRVGLSEEELLRSVARGLGQPEERVRSAYLETHDLAGTARLAAIDALPPAC